ncbi:hypothetical protein [Streptomyces sp. Da 82-17]|uniref:hypothetical protein n=1 Tax=Streptomyces sp. Da 82-17 TaxID=3377116 RepID=UPI0038D41081
MDTGDDQESQLPHRQRAFEPDPAAVIRPPSAPRRRGLRALVAVCAVLVVAVAAYVLLIRQPECADGIV